MWRVLTGLHDSFEFSTMEAGHTKFSPDWHFGLWKVLNWCFKFARIKNQLSLIINTHFIYYTLAYLLLYLKILQHHYMESSVKNTGGKPIFFLLNSIYKKKKGFPPVVKKCCCRQYIKFCFHILKGALEEHHCQHLGRCCGDSQAIIPQWAQHSPPCTRSGESCPVLQLDRILETSIQANTKSAVIPPLQVFIYCYFSTYLKHFMLQV